MRIVGNPPSGGKKPTTPTIGTATDGGTGTTVSVAFTPSTYIGKSTITYTATSSPGSLTAPGSGSPITVSGLTTGTAYTFTVTGNTAYGVASDASAASNSVTPASPSSYESIATATGNGSSGTITFSSIPSTYKHLQIRAIYRDTYAPASLNTVSYKIQFNTDTASNYTQHFIKGTNATVVASGGANLTSIIIDTSGANSAASNTLILGASIVDIIDYADTSKFKTVRAFEGADLNNATDSKIVLLSGLWRSTSAISTITITANVTAFSTNTTFALYGIKG